MIDGAMRRMRMYPCGYASCEDVRGFKRCNGLTKNEINKKKKCEYRFIYFVKHYRLFLIYLYRPLSIQTYW